MVKSSHPCLMAWPIYLFIHIAVSFRSGPPFRHDNPWAQPICSEDLHQVGKDPSNWTVAHDVDTVLACLDAKIIDFPLFVPIADPTADILIRSAGSKLYNDAGETPSALPVANSSWINQTVVLQITETEDGNKGVDLSGQVFTAATHLRTYLGTIAAGEHTTTIFYLHFGKSVVGIYMGTRVHKQLTSATVLAAFTDYVLDRKPVSPVVIQHCGQKTSGGVVFGIVSNSEGGVGGLAAVQNTIQGWHEGKCVGGSSTRDMDFSFWSHEPQLILGTLLATNSTSNSTFQRPARARHLRASDHNLATRAMAACSEIRVETNNTCYDLASRCGLSDIKKFYSYNNGIESKCTSLKLGQRICCSAGGLASHRQKPAADGTCATHLVKPGEVCDTIASDFDITTEEIKKFNDQKTWGWSGCGKNLKFDTLICVSEGDPPMPPPIKDAICGPQADKNTPRPPKGTSFASVNPCPLNACCSQWGWCGTDDDHCSTKVAQGKDNFGTGGCISNCGTSIVNNKEPPTTFLSIAYFEGWNWERPCLWTDISKLSTSGYTHIHFAFAKLTNTFSVDVSSMQSQFNKFKSLKGVKRVISFGGWDDSTAPDKYWIFREVVKPQNRDRVIQNLVDFVTSNGLDGLDIDWEYPAAPDIPEIPKADPKEGDAYLEFLKTLRKRLPKGVSLSIATPAGFWYLQGFPILEISKVVDYIIYMTYDFHGQWDWGKKYSIDGCPTGDCLRSHINMTETMSALTLITKAGIPSNKVIVGVASYGRSFKMVQPGCTGPMCPFAGKASGAKPGLCTGTPGYLANAEIDKIINDPNSKARIWTDTETLSNILVYDGDNWVAYMDDTNKRSRTMLYRFYNFGGTTDWAADLQAFGTSEYMTDDTFKAMSQNDGRCPWKNVEGFHCDSLASSDTTLPGKVRWQGTACDCAWADFMQYWETGKAKQNTFSQAAASFFNAGENRWSCEDVVVGCWQNSDQCKDVQTDSTTGPAGALIMSSFAAVNGKLNEMWTALIHSQGEATVEFQAFYDTFTELEIRNDQRSFLLSIDILGIFFSVFSAPFFNYFLKGHNNLKDITYNMVSWGGSYIKDETQFPNTDGSVSVMQLNNDMLNVYKGWQSIVSNITTDLFKGEGEGLNYFYEIIRDGKWVTQGSTKEELQGGWNDPIARIEWAQKVHYSMMIPVAWYDGNRHGFVLDTGRDCGSRGYLNGDKMASSTEEKTMVCRDNRLYYFVAPAFNFESEWTHPEGCTSGGHGPDWPCLTPSRPPQNYFVSLPGTDDLRNADNRWGKVTLDDIVHGSLNTYDKNGRKNGAEPNFNLKDKDSFNKLWDGSDDPVNIRAPGIFRFPVCGPDEAFEGWKNAPDHKSPEKNVNEERRYWPCKGP